MQCHGGQHDRNRHQGRHGSDPGPNWPKIWLWAAGLGALSSTGGSTGPHLDLGVYRDRRALDPQSWLP